MAGSSLTEHDIKHTDHRMLYYLLVTNRQHFIPAHLKEKESALQESNGFPMTIHLSEAAHKELVPVLGDDYFVSVGKRNIKGKGTLQTYLAKVGCGCAYAIAVGMHSVRSKDIFILADGWDKLGDSCGVHSAVCLRCRGVSGKSRCTSFQSRATRHLCGSNAAAKYLSGGMLLTA